MLRSAHLAEAIAEAFANNAMCRSARDSAPRASNRVTAMYRSRTGRRACAAQTTLAASFVMTPLRCVPECDAGIRT